MLITGPKRFSHAFALRKPQPIEAGRCVAFSVRKAGPNFPGSPLQGKGKTQGKQIFLMKKHFSVNDKTIMKQIILLSLLWPYWLFAQEPGEAKNRSPRKKMTSSEIHLMRGPYLQVATSNSILVRWRTDALSRSRVRYGTSPDHRDQVVDDGQLVTEHGVKLTGLQPGTKYYYSIGSISDTLQGDRDNCFVTFPERGTEKPYRIAVLGDCGTNSVNQRNVRDALVKYLGDNPLDNWIILGDNAYPHGTDAEYQSNFFNVYQEAFLKKYPLYPTMGNHDYHDLDYDSSVAQTHHDVAYFHDFSLPQQGEAGGTPSHSPSYYAYDLGNIHFISLDSYGIEKGKYRLFDPEGPQMKWLKKDLENNKNRGWIIAYWHHPPYSMGSHNSDKDQELVRIRENLVRVLESYGVDLVLCGHSHDYERSRLIRGYYGFENQFDTGRFNLSQSSGRYDGSKNSCPYIKEGGKNKGIVYVVTGSAGKIGPTQAVYPHDALPYADATHAGAVLLEVNANRLDLQWICADGVIRDHFTMMKQLPQIHAIKAKKGESVLLKASFEGEYEWSWEKQTERRIRVVPPLGKSVYTVRDSHHCLEERFEVEVTD